MKCLQLVFLIFSALTLASSSPIRSCSVEHMDLFKVKSFISKIQELISTAYELCVSEKDLKENNLEYLKVMLEIPPAPRLVPPPEHLTCEASMTTISAGLQTHHRLLQDMQEKLKCSDTLTSLLSNVAELNAQIQKAQDQHGVPRAEPQAGRSSLSERVGDDEYALQVAAHLVLEQLRRFSQDGLRTLRHMSAESKI